LRIAFWLSLVSPAAATVYGSAIGPSSFTNATLVDFDDLAGGDCNLCGPSVTNQYASQGVTFNNPSYPRQDTADTNLVPFFPLSSPPNALFVEQGGMIGDPSADPFQILFSVPVTMVGFDFGSSTNAYLQLSAYGSGGELLETLTYTGTAAPIGLQGFAGIQEASPITKLDVSYILTGTTRTLNFSMDNLEFQGPVPEPAALSLVAAGLCGIALAQGGRQSLRKRFGCCSALRPRGCDR
jgi:hypothetical protein